MEAASRDAAEIEKKLQKPSMRVTTADVDNVKVSKQSSGKNFRSC